MSQLITGIKNIFIVLVLLNITPSLIVGIKDQYFAFLTPQTKVATITIDSMIDSSEPYIKHLQDYFKDHEVKALLLKIESPGGTPGSCQSIFNEIQYLKKKYPKPIIVLTENMCASGAYYIACAVDSIIASPACLIGSIGARFTTLFDTKKLLQQYNIEPYTITSGKYKGAMNPFETLTPEQHAMLQNVSNNTYEQFAHDVAIARKLSFAQKEIWADGKIFTGQQALKLGLIDQLGSYSIALEKLYAVAPIEGEINWIKPHDDKWLGWADMIKKTIQGGIESSVTKLCLLRQ
ncbi:MAG: protease-4 [Alteromonas naphthalenivorans]|jgi:protease-4